MLRNLLLTSCLASNLFFSGATTALAQTDTYPNKPIHLITPVAPGGTSDILSRIISEKLSANFNQSVIVENRPGAAGMVGTEYAGRAAPDGYTLVNVTSSHVVFKDLYKDVRFDALKDFVPIVLLARTPLTLVVANNLPVKNTKEFVAYAKANPDKLGFGTSGIGSAVHLAMEKFEQDAGIKLVHVPYKGGAPALQDIIGGNIPVVMSGLFTVTQSLKAHQIRALFVTSAKRSPLFPDIPTAQEVGYPGYEANEWWAILAPANTPSAIVDKLNAKLNQTFKQPDVQAKLDQLGIEFVGGSSAQAKSFMQDQAVQWAKVIKTAGIKAE